MARDAKLPRRKLLITLQKYNNNPHLRSKLFELSRPAQSISLKEGLYNVTPWLHYAMEDEVKVDRISYFDGAQYRATS